MKNLTLRIDEKVLAAARKEAALRGTTVAKVVREYLTAYAVAHLPASAAAAKRARPSGEQAADAPGFAEPSHSYEDQAALPESAAHPPTLVEMTTVTGAPPVPGHDAWFRRQVQKALDDKKAGKSDYVDFDAVAAKFGFNAR